MFLLGESNLLTGGCVSAKVSLGILELGIKFGYSILCLNQKKENQCI